MSCEWMKRSVGVGVHWTTYSARRDGTLLPFREAVDAFDVDRFVASLAEAGADHCLMTLTHAEQYLAFPNEPLERLMPGRTARRDLVGEIIAGLSRAGIRFIAYYNHSCNGEDDPPWKEACGYAAGRRGDLDAFARNICDIVEFTARRYGDGLAGWWFDSAYSVDPKGPHNTVSCDMGDWQFPWDALHRAAQAGSGRRGVCVNAGIASNFLYTPYQEYYAGETELPEDAFAPEEAPGLIGHRWICMDNRAWVFGREAAARGFSAPRFPEERVARFVKDNLASGRMTTFNMEIDQTGVINPMSLAQFAAVKKTAAAL